MSQITLVLPSAFPSTTWEMNRLIEREWMVKASRSRKYYFLVALISVGFLTWSTLFTFKIIRQHDYPLNWTLTFSFLSLIGFCCSIELTRIDRTILKQLLRTFEWWYLFGNTLIVTALNFATTDRDISYELLYGLYVPMTTYAISMDAMVQLHPRFKIGVLIILLINNIHIGLPDTLTNTEVHSFNMCLMTCADARSMLYGSAGIITAYLLKQLYMTARYPNCTALLNQQYQLSINNKQQPPLIQSPMPQTQQLHLAESDSTHSEAINIEMLNAIEMNHDCSIKESHRSATPTVTLESSMLKSGAMLSDSDHADMAR